MQQSSGPLKRAFCCQADEAVFARHTLLSCPDRDGFTPMAGPAVADVGNEANSASITSTAPRRYVRGIGVCVGQLRSFAVGVTEHLRNLMEVFSASSHLDRHRVPDHMWRDVCLEHHRVWLGRVQLVTT